MKEDNNISEAFMENVKQVLKYGYKVEGIKDKNSFGSNFGNKSKD